MEPIQVILMSNEMIHTPGIFRWAIHGYKTGDAKKMVQVLMKGYGLDRDTADGLLSGRIPHKVRGSDVIFIRPTKKTIRKTKTKKGQR